jgi:nitroreductase
MDYQTIEEIIKSRRSLYPAQMDENKKIPDEDIWKLLELANYAPNHKLTEPWRFKIFSGEKVKDFYDLLIQVNSEWTSVDEMRPKAKKLQEKAKIVSHVIVLYMKRDPQERVPAHEEEYACACAMQNMLLGMNSLNTIGYWGTGKAAASAAMRKALKLGKEDKCIGFLQLGVPKILPPESSRRKPGDVKEKTEWM